MMQSIRDLVANDAHAITFQSMAQYRTALLKAIDQLAAGAHTAASRYFVYSPEIGFEEYATDKERDEAHESEIQNYLVDGWDEQVEQVVSGIITHTTTKDSIAANPNHADDCSCAKCEEYRDAGGSDEYSEICNYVPAAIAAPPGPANRIYPQDLTPALREALSLMVWRSGQIAHVLRAGGADIPRKAEAEQAHVLHWLIQLALDHGNEWWSRAYASLKEIQDASGNSKETSNG